MIVNINKKRNNDNVFINNKNISKLRTLNSKDIMVLMGFSMYSTPCSSDCENGGQMVGWDVDVVLVQKHNIKKSTVNDSIKKLINNNVIIKNNDEQYFQINPEFCWIPSDSEHITDDDMMSRDALSLYFNQFK